ncbi:MAG: alpha/beta hydrolase [Rhizobiales bacterium]|nr:alpha/beta hydrolase [Hyphomicrobiales bacterium]
MRGLKWRATDAFLTRDRSHSPDCPPAGGQPPLLLLHGTGGDENDLLPLGQALALGRALISPRGQVLENGMPRFFRGLAEGAFDFDDVRRRGHELADFVAAARVAYGLEAPVALGFSNGANIAAAMLLLRPEALAGAILLRAMVPLDTVPKPDLSGKRVLLVSGRADPILPLENARRLADLLRTAGAEVQHETLATGHALAQDDLRLATAWLNRKD